MSESSSTTSSAGTGGESAASSPPALRRTLTVWEAIGVSIALMAPSMAININPQGTAGLVGRAVPLAFLLATVGVLLIAYTFVRLSQRFNHAGSVYGFVGATLGARAGITAGWLNAATYVFYGVVTSMAAGIFVTELVDQFGIWPAPPTWATFVFAWIALGVVWFLGSRPAKRGTLVLVVVEGVTIALILIVAVIVLGRLLAGDTPNGTSFDLSVFTVPEGTDLSTVFLGIVFGFLSFAGFEAAATLGEEAREPRRDIPRAILGTAIFGGLFFVIVTAIEVMAFGTDAAGIASFIDSGALIGDLANAWIAPWLGDVITVGAAVSAAACALACIVGSSRLLFALSRDGLGPRALAHVHPRHGVPNRAVAAVVGLVALIEVIGLVLGAAPYDLFAIAGVTGTLVLLVAYLLASIGAVRLLFFSGQTLVSRWEIVIPILGIAVLAYTLFRNVFPLPTEAAAWWGPGMAIAIVVVVLAVVVARPAAARRAGERLTASEGLRSAAD